MPDGRFAETEKFVNEIERPPPIRPSDGRPRSYHLTHVFIAFSRHPNCDKNHFPSVKPPQTIFRPVSLQKPFSVR